MSWVQSIGRWSLYAAVLTSVLLKGATAPIPLLLSSLLIGVSLLCGFARPAGPPALERAARTAFAFVAVLCAYVLFQSASFGSNPFANPIWSEAAALIGTPTRSVSIEPAATRGALATLLAPLLAYIAAIRNFDDDTDAFRLLGFLGHVGAGFAIFGLVQISLLPDSLLFFEKTVYLDSLTSVFVNRNTAGTFLGVGSLILLTLAFASIRRIEGPNPLRRLVLAADVDAAIRRRVGLLTLFWVLSLLALALTTSRGALLAALASYLLVVPALVFELQRGRQTSAEASRTRSRRRAVAVVAGIAVVLLAAAFLGGQTFSRMEGEGVDVARFCVYEASLSAFRDSWLFGTGFGTFEDVFPAYRTSDCAGAYGVFLRAHNFYVEGLLGFGIWFLPLVLFAYGRLIADFSNGLRHRRRYRHVPMIALAAVLLVTFHGFVDFSLQIPGIAVYLAAYLGAATSISLQREGRRRARSSRGQAHLAPSSSPT